MTNEQLGTIKHSSEGEYLRYREATNRNKLTRSPFMELDPPTTYLNKPLKSIGVRLPPTCLGRVGRFFLHYLNSMTGKLLHSATAIREMNRSVERKLARNLLPDGAIACLTIALSLLLVANADASSINVTVPGSANPWLAGMPDGSTASVEDESPAQSPVEVVGISIVPGTSLKFSATGLTAHGPTKPLRGPDGSGFSPHSSGAENGISDTYTRIDSLQGVFLGSEQPDLTPAPDALDFGESGNVQGGVNYTYLSPLLKQVFFIGDGMTDEGQMQQVVVPNGATRLFLGTKDGCCWHNNIGEFEVQIAVYSNIPEPSMFMLACLGLLGLTCARRKPL